MNYKDLVPIFGYLALPAFYTVLAILLSSFFLSVFNQELEKNRTPERLAAIEHMHQILSSGSTFEGVRGYEKNGVKHTYPFKIQFTGFDHKTNSFEGLIEHYMSGNIYRIDGNIDAQGMIDFVELRRWDSASYRFHELCNFSTRGRFSEPREQGWVYIAFDRLAKEPIPVHKMSSLLK